MSPGGSTDRAPLGVRLTLLRLESVENAQNGLAGAPAPADAGLDEFVDLAVEHRGRVARLDVGPQVLHQLVGVQDVVADLGAPTGRAVAPDLGHLGGFVLPPPLEQ